MTKAPQASRKRVNTQSATKGKKPDPIHAAIAAHKAASKAWEQASLELDRAQGKARKKLGLRPFGLVTWRGQCCGSVSELRDHRQHLLGLGKAPRDIAKEYRDMRQELAAQIIGQAKWDRRAGIVGLRHRAEARSAAERAAAQRMAKATPRTLFGAALLLSYTIADMEGGETHWHEPALNGVAAALFVGAGKYEWGGLSRKAVARLLAMGKAEAGAK